jgi:hypothetical protein
MHGWQLLLGLHVSGAQQSAFRLQRSPSIVQQRPSTQPLPQQSVGKVQLPM